MGFFGFKSQAKKISITLNDHVIRMMELNPSDRSIRTYNEHYLPEGIIQNGKILEQHTLQVILEECVEEWGIKGRKVHFLVPDTYLVLRNEKIPRSIPDDEIKGYLYLEIGATIKLPFSDVVFDYELIGEDEEHKEILLFAAPEHIVTDLSAALEAVKLQPESADVTALALYRLYYHNGLIDAEEPTLLIHGGIQTMNVSVFYNHKPAFIRQILIDTPHSKWELKQTSRTSYAMNWTGERLELLDKVSEGVTEIERVINYYYYSMSKSGKNVEKALLSGDFPESQMLKERLEEILDIEVEHREQIVDSEEELLPLQYYTAFGLALKGYEHAN